VPADDDAVAFVDTRDIAQVAAAALTEEGHDEQVYELTGPEPLSHAAALATLGTAAGRDLSYTAPSPEDFAAGMRAAGVGDTAVRWQLALFELIRSGVNAAVTDTVEKITGTPARTLAAYAAEHAAALRA
jgi:uncharacterized protein YbjT (DUF2867 family)